MCKNCDWEGELSAIEELLDSGDLSDSADDFLRNVKEWVEDNHHITPAQSDAVGKFDK